MRKLSVSALVSLDGVIQDPGGFGETEYPIVLGYGMTLFPRPALATTLQLARARTLDSGVVNLTYVRAGQD